MEGGFVEYVLIIYWFLYSMVMSTYGGDFNSGFGLGSGSGAEPIDERVHKFVSFEITHDVLDANPVMFSNMKRGDPGAVG